MDCFLWNRSQLFLLILVEVFFNENSHNTYKPPWNICGFGQQNKKIQLIKKYRENKT